MRGRVAHDAVSIAVRRVRRRHDGAVLAHGVATATALLACAAVVTAASALAGGPRFFLAGLVVAAGGVAAGLLVVAVRARRRWLSRQRAPTWIDRRCGLAERLESLVALGDRGDPALTALLRAQTLTLAPRFAPAVVVPRVVPWRPLAVVAVALAALGLTVVSVPPRRAARTLLAASDGGGAPIAARSGDIDADGLTVFPDDTRRAPVTDAGADAIANDEGALIEGAATLQDWLRAMLGAGDGWTETDPAALASAQHPRERRRGRRGRRSDIGTGPDGADHGDGPSPADDGRLDARVREAARAGAVAATGGAGAGAGAGTDPRLFGPVTTAHGATDRFELSIAARVRARAGGSDRSWGKAPPPEPDTAPPPRAGGPPAAPFHPAVVPPAWAGVARRLYARSPAIEASPP